MVPPKKPKPTPAQRREERRKAKEVKTAENSANLLDRMVDEVKEVRYQGPVPGESKGIRLVEAPPERKEPATEAQSEYSYMMSWCHSHSDTEGMWSWGESRAWSEAEYNGEILSKMADYEDQSWAHICNLKTPAKGNKHVPLNKKMPLDALCKDAQDRWIGLGLEQFDTAFRFRFGGTKRAWGIKKQGHFFLIWYEREHKICPSNQSHT